MSGYAATHPLCDVRNWPRLCYTHPRLSYYASTVRCPRLGWYAFATRCPVLTSAQLLRLCYAMS
eukprot:2794048-Rhodomonas_salina.1